jgi:hypothetical protein
MLVLLGLLMGSIPLFGVGCHNIRVSPKPPEEAISREDST